MGVDSKNFEKSVLENANLRIIKIRIFLLTMMTVLCRYCAFNKTGLLKEVREGHNGHEICLYLLGGIRKR